MTMRAASGPSDGGPRVGSSVVGVRKLGRALVEARGGLSQRAAARQYGVSLSTLMAIEQGKARRYRATTLHQFDVLLGRSALEVYQGSDEPPEALLVVELKDYVGAELASLRQLIIERIPPVEPRGGVEEIAALAEQLSADDREHLLWLLRRAAR